MRGYFGIGVYHPKTGVNIGTLWRSAMNFDAAFLFTIGRRYKHQASDTLKVPRHIPLYHFKDFAEFNNSRPYNCPLIGVEQTEQSSDIGAFRHPERCIYLLGAEDGGIPVKVLDSCQQIISINTPMCLNVAVAGSIVMFDRQNKRGVQNLHPHFNP